MLQLGELVILLKAFCSLHAVLKSKLSATAGIAVSAVEAVDAGGEAPEVKDVADGGEAAEVEAAGGAGTAVETANTEGEIAEFKGVGDGRKTAAVGVAGEGAGAATGPVILRAAALTRAIGGAATGWKDAEEADSVYNAIKYLQNLTMRMQMLWLRRYKNFLKSEMTAAAGGIVSAAAGQMT